MMKNDDKKWKRVERFAKDVADGRINKLVVHSIPSQPRDEPDEPGRYQVRTGWLGGHYLLDTRSAGYKISQFALCLILLPVCLIGLVFFGSLLYVIFSHTPGIAVIGVLMGIFGFVCLYRQR
ncbi:MAG: SUR7/PalI family protein [Planctomycetaceae bacterium]|nr:SUR7/PalI family protein [Planctomycetaceae bacterium]